MSHVKKLFPLILLILLLSSFVSAGHQGGNSAPVAGGVNRPGQQRKPYVILISLDGFRADYLDKFEAPNLRRIMTKGARAEGLIPIFPSKTFPNHYAVVTGLYAEHHGLVANSFYDSQRGESYTISDTHAVRDGTWYRGEPVWVTAEKQGMVAGCFFWPGSEAAIAGVKPSYVKPYDGSVPNEVRVDTVLSWLRLPAEQRPHMLTLYMSDVDTAGHDFGQGTPQVGTAIQAVDRAIGRLLDGIESLPIHEQVYVVVVSDHGMADSTPQQYEAIDELIDMKGVRLVDFGPNANLHVSGGMQQARNIRDALNWRLQHGRAYLRAEVPARFHYRADPRAGDVVVIMQEHYLIGLAGHGPKTTQGNHGWDPYLPSMHGIFLVAGPGIKEGATIPRFRNVHIYPFLAELLGLKPARNIDGRRGWLRRLAMERPNAVPVLTSNNG